MAISFSYDNVLPKPGLGILKNHTKSLRVGKAVANGISCLRIPTVPMAIWGFWPNYVHGHHKAATIWLVSAVVLAALSDAYDGLIARELFGGSEFGAFLDALMDKVFACAYLILLLVMIHRALGHWDNWIFIRLSIDATLGVMAFTGKKLLGDREISNKSLPVGKIKFNLDVAAVTVGFLLFINASSNRQFQQALASTNWLVLAACLFGAASVVQHGYYALTAKKKTAV